MRPHRGTRRPLPHHRPRHRITDARHRITDARHRITDRRHRITDPRHRITDARHRVILSLSKDGQCESPAACGQHFPEVSALISMIAPNDDPPVKTRDELVRAAKTGDREALEALVRSIWPDVFRIAWSVLRNHVAAEDAAQDACAQIAAKIATLRAPEAFTVWLYRTHGARRDTIPRDAHTCAP
jgi:hypothetical protein